MEWKNAAKKQEKKQGKGKETTKKPCTVMQVGGRKPFHYANEWGKHEDC